jgi:integrase
MAKSAGAWISDCMHRSGMQEIGSDTHRGDETRQAIEQGFSGRHEIAARIGIHNSLTYARYKSTWRDYINYCRGEGGYGKDPRTYPASSVADYMQHRIEAGCSSNTLQSIGSAMGKWAAACDRAYGGNRFQEWATPISEARALGRQVCPRLDQETRAFKDPWRVIAAMPDPRARLAATIQLTTGLRSMNVCKLQLNQDGSLYVKSKAGYTAPHFAISPKIADVLRGMADSKGRVNLIGYKAYIGQIQAACAATGEKYTGSHAFRHNYTQARYAELRQGGMSEDRAKLQVSEELFHHRLDVVDKYLR